MERIKLVEICNPKQWKTIPTGELLDEGYPVYGANGVIGYYDEYNHENPVVAITCRGATCGAINITVPQAYVTGNAMCLDDVRDDIEIDYLYYCLKHYDFTGVISGSAQPQITRQGLNKVDISICSHEEQLEIIDNLKKVEAIIKLREEELCELDDLIKARFVEMFGDPISNPLGWEKPLIEDVVSTEKNALKAGPFGSSLKKEYYVESGYKIYGQEQVIAEDPNYGDYYIDEDRYKQLENCAVQAGDVLISLVGTYGKLLIMPESFEPGIINPRLMKITFDKSKVNPYYFKYYFQSESLKRALAENTHGGTMDILNLGIVRKIAMPLPPIELQNAFVEFIEQVDKSKVVVKKSLDETKKLFDSLMQKYFG